MAGLGALLLYNKKIRWWAIALGIFSLLFIIFGLPHNNSIRQELLAEDRSGELRQNIWAETTELLLAHPIKGAGLASYSQAIYPYRIDKSIEVFHHPHNIFLTIWVNTGLIGLIGFVWILVWFFHTSLNKPTTYKLQATTYITCAMVVIIVMGLVDSPYIKNDLSLLFWLLPALLILETRTAASE